jgi:hypothetical protein
MVCEKNINNPRNDHIGAKKCLKRDEKVLAMRSYPLPVAVKLVTVFSVVDCSLSVAFYW